MIGQKNDKKEIVGVWGLCKSYKGGVSDFWKIFFVATQFLSRQARFSFGASALRAARGDGAITPTPDCGLRPCQGLIALRACRPFGAYEVYDFVSLPCPPATRWGRSTLLLLARHSSSKLGSALARSSNLKEGEFLVLHDVMTMRAWAMPTCGAEAV